MRMAAGTLVEGERPAGCRERAEGVLERIIERDAPVVIGGYSRGVGTTTLARRVVEVFADGRVRPRDSLARIQLSDPVHPPLRPPDVPAGSDGDAVRRQTGTSGRGV